MRSEYSEGRPGTSMSPPLTAVVHTGMGEIQFKIICLALFTIQSLQSHFTGNYVSKIDVYCRNSI